MSKVQDRLATDYEESLDADASESDEGFGPACRNRNVGQYERIASLAGGVALAAYGLKRGRLLLAGLGAALAARGATGRCRVYRALGVTAVSDRPHNLAVIPAQRGAKVEKSVTINRPASELYDAWRDLESLPRMMKHLQSVKVIDEVRSHWVAVGALGRTVEWDAEIFNDRANEIIAWRSIPGGDVDTAGSVHFKTLPHGRGTQVSVSLKYDPPGGKIGVWLAALTGNSLKRQLVEDLRDFKRRMETGEVAMPAGHASGAG